MARGDNLRGKGGPGRPPGLCNRVTRTVKDMVETALKNAGGAKYLERQAMEEPAAFLTLVGKLIPKDINLGGDKKGSLSLHIDLSASHPAARLPEQQPALLEAGCDYPEALPAVGETVSHE